MVATTFLSANNAGSTLASSMTSTTTTLVLATGGGAQFPSPNAALGQYFALTLVPAASSTGLPNEIVYVTACSGDTCTVLRAQEGTAALTWAVGDTAQLLWTKGQALSLVQQAQLQVQATNYAADTGTANAGVVTLPLQPVSLASLTGAPIRVQKGSSANTGAYTLNINGLGAAAVVLPNGGALPAGTLPANTIFEVVPNASGALQLISTLSALSPSGAAGGDLTGNYPSPTIAGNAVSNAKMAQMLASTIKANLTGLTANPQDVTLAALLSALGFSVTTNANGTALNLAGQIVQFGQTAAISQNTGAYTVTLPVSFPTGPYPGSAQATLAPTSFASGTDYGATVIGSPGASSMQVSVGAYGTNPTGTAFPVNWVVWGN